MRWYLRASIHIYGLLTKSAKHRAHPCTIQMHLAIHRIIPNAGIPILNHTIYSKNVQDISVNVHTYFSMLLSRGYKCYRATETPLFSMQQHIWTLTCMQVDARQKRAGSAILRGDGKDIYCITPSYPGGCVLFILKRKGDVQDS